jgi:hypothetical protein
LYSNTEDPVTAVSSIGDSPTSFVWTVQLYQFDLSVSNVFFFWVNIYSPDAAASAYFNIINNQSGSSSATTISTLGSATASASSSSLPPASNGISIGVKESVGIALGIGIPVVISILAIMFVLLKRVKSKKPQEQKGKPPIEINGDCSHKAEKPSHAELPANHT